MRILHTSDWHLGKTLEGYSRISEQKKFISELIQTIQRERIDLVLISGDIYDSSNPPAEAEKLFYKAMTAISEKGKRPIVVTAGECDNSERLGAISSFALENGIIIMGNLDSVESIQKVTFEHFAVKNSGIGFVEIEINGESVVVASTGYPSEPRLNEFIYRELHGNNIKTDYKTKLKDVVDKLSVNFRDDTINILMGHFYFAGGIMEDSERNISLGDAFAVDSEIIPQNVHYVAMGHLHRPQRVAKAPVKHAYYAGSPIPYGRSEINHPKCVLVFDVNYNNEGLINRVMLTNYKPIEVWNVDGYTSAVRFCEEHKDRDCYVYLEIRTIRYLRPDEIKELKSIKKDIVEVIPVITKNQKEETEESTEKFIEEDFQDFYYSMTLRDASEEQIQIFLSVLNETEESNDEED